MDRSIIKLLGLIWSLMVITLACGGETQQRSGIVATLAFDTIACRPFSREVLFRNPSTEEAQSFMGVYIEPGSNPHGYFKLKKLKVNDREHPVLGGAAADILVPPGANVVATVAYNPRAVTRGDETHRAVLTYLFNGPDRGVVQYELLGKAKTMYEGCGEGPVGELYSFTVEQIDFTIVGEGFDNQKFEVTIPGSEIAKPFQFYDVDGVATLLKEEFPEFEIYVELEKIELTITLADDEVIGTFDGSSLVFDPITFSATPILVPGVMSTEALSLSGDPESINLELEGQPFDGDTMKLVFVGKPLYEALEGSVAGATFHLKAQ